MKMETIEEKENPVLKRKSFIFKVDYGRGATISKADLQKKVATELKAELNHIEVKKIISETGKSIGRAWVHIWKEKEVPIYGVKKEDKKEEVKKEEPKPIEKAEKTEEEKPKEEERKEEPKKE